MLKAGVKRKITSAVFSYNPLICRDISAVSMEEVYVT